MIRKRNLMSDRGGNAAVEFGLVAPFVLMLLLGLLDVGRLFADQYALDQGVAVAARYAVVNSTSGAVVAASLTAFEQQVQPLLGSCIGSGTCTFSLTPATFLPGATVSVTASYAWTPSSAITAMPAQTLNSATTLTVQN
jgi:Flp pilus assembly protein TadG